MPEERIERLITRKLDGVLSEEESLELDRALLRSLEVRNAFETTRRIDELARRCLRASLDRPGDLPALPPVAIRPGSRWRSRILAAGLVAVAASILLVAGRHTVFLPGEASGPAGPIAATARPVQVAGADTPASSIDAVSQVRYAHVVNREVLGVYDDETRSLYLLEIDRTHLRPVSARASY